MNASESSLFVADANAAHAASVQRCAQCQHVMPIMAAAVQCAQCQGLLEILHARPMRADGTPLLGDDMRRTFLPTDSRPHDGAPPGPHASGVWRYQSLVMPDVGSAMVSHPEGNTPLLSRERIDRFVGLGNVMIKHEGHNPTGSFKDRGMTVGVTHAVRIGASGVACASTGNTSASLASYASHAGIPGLVFVPSGNIALGKLAQTLGYGARTLLVRGDFDACLRLVQDTSRELGVYLLNSVNPWRIEGQKTIVFELLQQLGWEAPDFIVLPAGNLGNTAAFGKALREALALGLIDRLPRVVAVQAAGAAPFAHGFANQFASRHSVKAETIATAIKIGDPASWDRGVRTIRDTNGIVLAVSDADIIAAKMVIDRAGVGCEPASAASIAGIKQLVERGVITSAHRVVAILTGHVLKDPGILVDLHSTPTGASSAPDANPPVEIDADVREVEKILHQIPQG
jgi:threonine synthase